VQRNNKIHLLLDLWEVLKAGIDVQTGFAAHLLWTVAAQTISKVSDSTYFCTVRTQLPVARSPISHFPNLQTVTVPTPAARKDPPQFIRFQASFLQCRTRRWKILLWLSLC
jgi:hypothetical protein